jgi:hypothetical protein
VKDISLFDISFSLLSNARFVCISLSELWFVKEGWHLVKVVLQEGDSCTSHVPVYIKIFPTTKHEGITTSFSVIQENNGTRCRDNKA